MAIGKHSATTTLRAGYASLALRIQEAASDLTNRDVSNRLGDAVKKAHQGTGQWAYYLDHAGDGDSGDAYYSVGDKTMCAPYSRMDTGDDDAADQYELDLDNAEEVMPRVVYEKVADDDDNYARMEESFRSRELYTDLPLYERFISKDERDKADAADFAGKGKSYPILQRGDIMAAVRSLGRAGANNLSITGIKRNIIAIAKRKGWTSSLPKSWQDEATAKESAHPHIRHADRQLVLQESAATVDVIELIEGAAAKSDYEIKLIAPGPGTTAYYPAEVLKSDGPKVFTEGTKVFLNHQTSKEEAERPEGDVKDLAGVLTTNAEYKESHAKGPGLYARMKVFADHANTVAEKGKHLGMSIRAFGTQAVQEGRKLLKDGLPVLGSFKASKSVDIVAAAGAGGLILTEAAAKKKKTTAMKDCPDCNGSGDCSSCDGTGKMMGKEAAGNKMVECTDCQGSGECQNCDGGGKLMEAARSPQDRTIHTQENDMDEATVTRLIEAAVSPLKAELAATKTKNAALIDLALRGQAREAAAEILDGMPLREGAKSLILTDCLSNIPAGADGMLDVAKFKEAVTARAKTVAAAFGYGPQVTGMGTAAAAIDVKEAAAAAVVKEADLKSLRESAIDTLATIMGGNRKAAEIAIDRPKGVAA